MSWQQVIINGNLGANPEMRYMPDGTAVTNVSVATNKTWKDFNGVKQQETTWWRISAWRDRAEFLHEWFKKGDAILVVGEMKPDPATGSPRLFNRNDGSVGASYEVTALNITFPAANNREQGVPSSPAGGQTQQVEEDDDDIPF